MAISVAEAYPFLWHYTTASGLYGIIRSQQLWATNIFYLNDGEEFSGFFDRKLIHLLEDGVREGIAEKSMTVEGRKFLDAKGGAEVVQHQVPIQLLAGLRAATLKLNAYVTSFCHTKSGFATEDGLLSQWRAYGTDGGYAIVFDSQKLSELLDAEHRRFFYSFLRFGDVDYHEDDVALEAKHPESLEWEASIRKVIAGLIVQPEKFDIANQLFDPMISLSTRHKHRGFREESEVRIVAGTPNELDTEEARSEGETRHRKPVYFEPRNGVLVPHIALFERPAGEMVTLPIKQVVVGPHSERLKRQKAVRLLLDQCGIEADVTTSDIPYLGR